MIVQNYSLNMKGKKITNLSVSRDLQTLIAVTFFFLIKMHEIVAHVYFCLFDV